MPESNPPFTCPEIERIDELYAEGDRRAASVTAIIDSLAAAQEVERRAAELFGASFSDDDARLVDAAVADRQRVENRIAAIRRAFDWQGEADDLTRIAQMAKEEITLSDEMRDLFIAAYRAKAEAAESRIEPAREGLAARISKLFTGRRTAADAASLAESFSRQGQFFSRLKSQADGFRSTAGNLGNGLKNYKPSAALLAQLKQPFPSVEDFTEYTHD